MLLADFLPSYSEAEHKQQKQKEKRKAGEKDNHSGLGLWAFLKLAEMRRKQGEIKADNRSQEVCGLLINPPFIHFHHCIHSILTALGMVKQVVALRQGLYSQKCSVSVLFLLSHVNIGRPPTVAPSSSYPFSLLFTVKT